MPSGRKKPHGKSRQDSSAFPTEWSAWEWSEEYEQDYRYRMISDTRDPGKPPSPLRRILGMASHFLCSGRLPVSISRRSSTRAPDERPGIYSRGFSPACIYYQYPASIRYKYPASIRYQHANRKHKSPVWPSQSSIRCCATNWWRTTHLHPAPRQER
jgi:hypothetical protein